MSSPRFGRPDRLTAIRARREQALTISVAEHERRLRNRTREEEAADQVRRITARPRLTQEEVVAQCRMITDARERYMRAVLLGMSARLDSPALLNAVGFTRCACCGEYAWDLVLDHNHSTGQLRGHVCGPCNVRIGHYEAPVSDPRVARRIEAYLYQHDPTWRLVLKTVTQNA